MEQNLDNKITGAIWGAICGDALGVPVEFVEREALAIIPMTGISGFGSHHQPPGTWSDDSSMILATMDSLGDGYDPIDMLTKFCEWWFECKYTAHGGNFDIGTETRLALYEFKYNNHWGLDRGERSNGNGSLMRIIPVPIYFRDSDAKSMIEKAGEISALTHGHTRAKLACAFFSLTVKAVLENQSLHKAYHYAVDAIRPVIPKEETVHFQRILDGNIADLPEEQIESSGYVMHTLEAALWCCLNTNSFADAVLKAVNLGEDTDTTGAVAGALAGALYGYDTIPSDWLETIVNQDLINELLTKFKNNLNR